MQERKVRRDWEETHASDELKELEASRAEEVVPRAFGNDNLDDWTKEVVLDEEAVVKVVRAPDARAEEAQRSELEVLVAGAEQLRYVLGEVGRENVVL